MPVIEMTKLDADSLRELIAELMAEMKALRAEVDALKAPKAAEAPWRLFPSTWPTRRYDGTACEAPYFGEVDYCWPKN